jgi:hypothetical protein
MIKVYVLVPVVEHEDTHYWSFSTSKSDKGDKMTPHYVRCVRTMD